jgi:GNAT superfamily N-acetyltransferase
LPAISIRPAVPADAGEILAMVLELALFEREPLTSVEATEEDFRRDCFGANRRCEVLIGEADGRVQGFIMFYYNYSTWVGRAGLHVEDFFVREAARGLGLGKRLLAAVAKIAVQRNCQRLDLAVLEWNPARKLYEHLGFTDQSHWIPYRLEGSAIAQLANDIDS